MKPLALTSGEPAGIGPDICLQLAAGAQRFPTVVLGDAMMLAERADTLNLPINIRDWQPGEPAVLGDHELTLLPIKAPEIVVPGELDPNNAHYVLALLDRALDGIDRGEFSGLVTGPVQKSVINDAGIAFTGHTEYLQARAGVDDVVMLLATEQLKVALVTTHLPLSAVPAAITPEKLQRICRIMHSDLQRSFGLSKPRILVCGLNPHAGENGHLGREEIEVIIPTLNTLRAEGLNVIGPLPADTLFTSRVLAQGDAVLAMYHDQGLPVLKHQGFGHAVNITLGLPFVRTSVDHGTALDLSGTGQADTGSLRTALDYAQKMVEARSAQSA
ncbi:MAG: 4-hydroxythreonine-4-phosphate dehydrogenase PdxA [Natronospirillum sp.]